ncbi:MAG: hypothetical protein JXR88_06110 [Clostridia bacterium]|nr:hypothetical protein [Clostridia bacterium]
MITIINGNLNMKELDLMTSELIYWIESKDTEVQYVILRQINDTATCEDIKKLVEQSEMVIYIKPIIEDDPNRLLEFFSHYTGNHPPIFLVLHSDHLLTVEEVDDAINEVESFAVNHDAEVLNVSYMKDALEYFKESY